MALNQDQLATLLENIASKGSRRLPSLVNSLQAQPAQSELGSLQQQSSNLATRISATGTPPKTDTRNPLEQMLNLTPDQNFLFDFFEIINRPQQALFGAISALQRGEDVGKGAWEGFTRTGDGTIDGGDLIRNMFGQTEDPNEGDIFKQVFDLTNWAGFALDVLADPADLGLLLVTGGAGNVAKEVAQTGAKLTDVTLESMQAGAKVAGAVDNVADVAKVAQGPTQNFLESLLLPKGQQFYKPKDLGEYMRMITPIIGRKERALKQITKTSFQNMAMQPLFKGMKMGTKLSDGAVSKALEMADPHTLDAYKALKKSIEGTVSEGGAKVKQAVGAMSNRLALATGVFKAVHTDYADYLYKLAKDTGISVDDIALDIQRYHEFANIPREISNVDFVNFIVGAPNKFVPITDETMDNIRALFGDEAFAMVKVRDLGPFKVAEFDPKYWNLENYSKLIKATEQDGMSNILTSSSRLEFEQSLKMKNPDEYATYSKLKSDYEADLNQRIEKQLEQEYPKASGVDEKKLATKRRSIEKRLRTEDLVAGRGPEFYLRSKVNSSEVSNYVMGKETRIHFVDQLTDADTLTYKRLLDQDNAEIDAMVTRKYPHVEGQTADARKAYDEQRRAYTAELRTDPASYKRSDDFLRKAIKEQDNTNITLFKSEDELNAFMEGDLAQVKKEVKHYPKAFKDKVIEVKKAETRVTELLAKGKGPGSKAYDNARAYLDKVRKELYLDYVDDTVAEVAPKVDVASQTPEPTPAVSPTQTVTNPLQQSLGYHKDTATKVEGLIKGSTRGKLDSFFVEGVSDDKLQSLVISEGVLAEDLRAMLNGQMWARDFVRKYPGFVEVLDPKLTKPSNVIGGTSKVLTTDDLKEITDLIDENMGELLDSAWTEAKDNAIRRVVEPTPTGRPKKVTERFIQLVDTALNVQEFGTEELRAVLIKIDREFGTELAEHKAFQNMLRAERSIKAKPQADIIADIRKAVADMRSQNSLGDITEVAEAIELAGRSAGLSAQQARKFYENFRDAIRRTDDWNNTDFGVKAIEDILNDEAIPLSELPNKISDKVDQLGNKATKAPEPTDVADAITPQKRPEIENVFADKRSIGPMSSGTVIIEPGDFEESAQDALQRSPGHVSKSPDETRKMASSGDADAITIGPDGTAVLGKTHNTTMQPFNESGYIDGFDIRSLGSDFMQGRGDVLSVENGYVIAGKGVQPGKARVQMVMIMGIKPTQAQLDQVRAYIETMSPSIPLQFASKSGKENTIIFNLREQSVDDIMKQITDNTADMPTKYDPTKHKYTKQIKEEIVKRNERVDKSIAKLREVPEVVSEQATAFVNRADSLDTDGLRQALEQGGGTLAIDGPDSGKLITKDYGFQVSFEQEAVPLSPEQRGAIMEKIKAMYGNKIRDVNRGVYKYANGKVASEISFYTTDYEVAMAIAKEYNQQSVLEWHGQYKPNFRRNPWYTELPEPTAVADDFALIHKYEDSLLSDSPVELSPPRLKENRVSVVDNARSIKRSGAILPDGTLLSADTHYQIFRSLSPDGEGVEDGLELFKSKGIMYFGLGETDADRSVSFFHRPTAEQIDTIQKAFDSFKGGKGNFTIIVQLDDMETISKVDIPMNQQTVIKDEVLKLMDDSPAITKLKQAVGQVDVKALDEATASIPPQTPPTSTPTVPAGKPTSIKIGNYYTQEQLDYFNSIKDQAWLKEGVQKFQETITKVQRTIGDLEFRDPDAIVRQSMQGYATHAVTPGVKQVLKDMWEKKMLKNGDAVTQFTPSKISPLKTRQYLGSAQEVNNFRKALYQEYFQNDEWLKANLIDIDDDLALQKLDEYFNQDLFSEDSRHSIEALMTETYSAIHKNHRTTEALIAMSLGNPNGEKSAIRVVKSGTGQVGGFIPLSLKETQNLLNALKSNQQFAGKGFFSDKLIDTLKEGLKTGNSVVVEEHLAKIIGAGADRTPKGALELLDKFNRMFKLGKTLSPGFNGKNFFGNAFNMWASGMELQDIAKYWNRAVVQHKTMRNIYAKLASTAPEEIIGADGTKTFKRVLDILSPEERKLYDVYQEFLDAGFLEKASVYKLQDIPLKVEGEEVIWDKSFSETTSATDKAKTIFDNPLSQANMAGNLFVDNHSRLALYLYAKEHPEYLSRLGFDPNDAKSAMNAVRFALFDPNDLTFFEDDVMKRLVPFYTFTRQNLLYQMKNLAKNSDRYYKLYKAYNAWNQEFADLSPEEMTDYQRNQFYLPVFGKKDGEFFTIKTSIPASALTEFSFDPQEVFQNYGSMLSPAFKAPFEWATGTSVFSGEPIERYEGEPGKNIGVAGNMLSKVDEWGLSQVGLDVPARGITGLMDMVGSLASGKPSEAVSGLNRFTGLTTQVSPERNAMSREYDRIEALNAQVRRLKESGIKVPTLDEIASTLQTTRNDKRLADMQAIVEMINKIKR